MNYPSFFQQATGYPPYSWQGRLANGEAYQADEPSTHTGVTNASRLIDIPTGLGKTAGVVLAWLWNRVYPEKPDWPRRLVYCLPMRTLVEQTESEARLWIDKLHAQHSITRKPRVVILMGGEDPQGDDKNWDLYPEEEAIIIGTQDMLLSRALNRGYGMSRYRWPMHFALLNNDCLWVMDEVQLMGAGLGSTTQLEGFRNHTARLGSYLCQSWWMSATIRPDWLKTVDLPLNLLSTDPLKLLETEKNDHSRVEALRTAPKRLTKAPIASGDKAAKAVAEFIVKNHSKDGINLVIVNTVKRARALHNELRKQLKVELKTDPDQLILLHSQFRPKDRDSVLKKIDPDKAGQIVVSTQVIEAGVDLSSHTLFTELAPWSSLVQRFGRCNRRLVNGQHHFPDARIFWFDLDVDKEAAPYATEQLTAARERLQNLESAAIADLEGIDSPEADAPKYRHVLRRKDIIELFDTTPDLAGADLDIDRFIRDTNDSNVHVFWRDWAGNSPNGDDQYPQEPAPRREELSSAAFAGKENASFKSFLEKNGPAWRWNPLDREWQKVQSYEIYPGQTYLLHASQGGYDQGTGDGGKLPTGWTGDPKNKVTPLPPENKNTAPAEEANDDDPASELDAWQTLAQHTDQVCAQLDQLLGFLSDQVGMDEAQIEILRQAARWHDWGKAHDAFQAKLHPERVQEAISKKQIPPNAFVAKAPGKTEKQPSAWRSLPRKYHADDLRRKHFRHELASALGILHPDSGFPLVGSARDLAAYLVAAHHGKVRLSIRSLPGEWIPPIDVEHPDERRFARGLWDGDSLPAANLGGDTHTQSIPSLSLELMELGLGQEPPFVDEPSWAERTLTLRDTFGIFRLAYLETLLRAADGRASAI